MSRKIVVIGSANTDMIIKSERFAEPGETLLGGDFFMRPGGKGANQAVSAARLGGDVTFVCKVGADELGQHSVVGYKQEGIDTSYVISDPIQPTGVALISVDRHGENKIIVAPGANGNFKAIDIIALKELIIRAEIVLLQLEIPLEVISKVLELCLQNSVRVVLNPAPAQTLPDWYYKDLFLITPNQTEAEQLTGIKVDNEDSALQACGRFHAMGVRNIVITMGQSGAYVFSDGYTGLISAPKREVIDTTGAGDIFNGALVVALAQKKGWKEAVIFACAAASLSVTKVGAQSSAPKQEEMELFYGKTS